MQKHSIIPYLFNLDVNNILMKKDRDLILSPW
jgi:hypothetical protein